VSVYRIVDIGDVPQNRRDERWLNLAEVRVLLMAGGWFTNEARSVLSLLLRWL